MARQVLTTYLRSEWSSRHFKEDESDEGQQGQGLLPRMLLRRFLASGRQERRFHIVRNEICRVFLHGGLCCLPGLAL